MLPRVKRWCVIARYIILYDCDVKSIFDLENFKIWKIFSREINVIAGCHSACKPPFNHNSISLFQSALISQQTGKEQQKTGNKALCNSATTR